MASQKKHLDFEGGLKDSRLEPCAPCFVAINYLP